jgi:hypothetical protein
MQIDSIEYKDFDSIKNLLINNYTCSDEDIKHIEYDPQLDLYDPIERTKLGLDDVIIVIRQAWCDSTLIFLLQTIIKVLDPLISNNRLCTKKRMEIPKRYRVGKLKIEIGSRSAEESIENSGESWYTTLYKVSLPVRIIW